MGVGVDGVVPSEGGDGVAPPVGGDGVVPPDGGDGVEAAATAVMVSFWPWPQWLDLGQMK